MAFSLRTGIPFCILSGAGYTVIPGATFRFKACLYAVLEFFCEFVVSHMAACASASSESSFRAASGSGFLNFAMLSVVCCCLFIFLFSPFCLSSASCDYIAYHFSTVLPPVFCRLTLTGISADNTVTAKTAVPLSVIRTADRIDVIVIPRTCAYLRSASPRPMSDTEPCFMTKRSGSNTRRRAISRPVRLTAEDQKSEKGC
ncbi:hypothetical protein BANRA_04858 [Escherichia coli]|nr:hypothetical protein BANRA_04858 [Escherichia coli]